MGKLLVSPRQSPDPSFAESVILLLHYDGQSALGLMINRRTTVPIARVLRDFSGLSIPETAEATGVSESTVKREWIIAKTWIRRRLLEGKKEP